MIERRDTLYGVQYWVVYGSNSESSDNEESLPKTNVTVVPSILAPAPINIVTPLPPPSLTGLPSSSIPLEERRTRVEEGQEMIE